MKIVMTKPWIPARTLELIGILVRMFKIHVIASQMIHPDDTVTYQVWIAHPNGKVKGIGGSHMDLDDALARASLDASIFTV